MNKLLQKTPALLLLALACAPCARAQESQTPKAGDAKSGEAVRERRVKPAEKSEASRAESDATDAELEALRAQGEAAASPAERGRLRLSLAERLAGAGRGAEAAQLLREMLAEERFDPQLFYNVGNALARL